jgi:hypothetical protein
VSEFSHAARLNGFFYSGKEKMQVLKDINRIEEGEIIDKQRRK